MDKFAFDRSPSARSFDDNGFMRVKSSHITKATVNPYYGREIPGWREAGLDPEKIYYGLRDPRELQKSIGTWEGLPLHIEHHPDSADEPETMTRVGAVGSARWANPYVDAPLYIWNQTAIDGIEDGSFRELSCAYRYEPDFTPGKFEGIDYDFVMRNIRGNHVALVEEGRAGADVLVADAQISFDGEEDDGWRTMENGKQVLFKDKKIIAGYIGQENNYSYQSKLIESLEPDLQYLHNLFDRHNGNVEEAAKQYFKERLQGRHVDAMADKWPIHAAFTATSWHKLSEDMNPIKAELMAHIPAIIATGEYRLEKPAHGHNNDRFNVFHTYRKKIMTSGGEKEAIVDVGERIFGPPVNVAYNLTREGTPKYERRSANAALHSRQSGNTPITPSQDSNAVDENNLIPQYEVVNIRFADETAENITKDARPKTIGGGVMRKMNNWFRGARDANPDVERAEVDLAQSILDLHKVDPQTGEIVDVTEDEDKAEEIRKIVGEISGKLEPEELKKLNDALSGLAYSKATGDSEPKEKPGMDEEMKSAMDACGLDSDDEDMSKAFAAGVDYGEKLEKVPGEREKLDREHESNGLKSAMDACGVDAENPQESKAFAEGVKYGEKLERDPEERKKLDKEHESEGAKAALDEDKNVEIVKILEEVPDLTDAQKKQLEVSIQDLFMSKTTGDEDMPAQDCALRKKVKQPRPLLASDAAIIQARAVAAAQDNMRRVAKAISEVRPLVGDLDMMAFDSATDVYGYTLEQCGVDRRKYEKSAWRGMVDMLRREKYGLADRRMAQDTKPVKLEGPFAGLAGISIGD